MKYKIALDVRKNIFNDLPVIDAKTPQKAAELYAGCKVKRHLDYLGGHLVVESTEWPHKKYLYDIA